ncbi:leukotoxin LktA family filamentous adhesin [Hydrogenophaga sp. PAMC20947]|uniref:leukotoxin LktA family filamentous adhesin n=1 Tax=Hydrogenophaga sp. PAMC20947 TaxID=2565558 RepID=UPI00109E0ED7|nr:leukotoxin LktA family filamentous adhesin [Hydrogenophaga sp. PAMC20947]QCB46258.1 leukotoxin LktA family filamentous adhesin [Hydrogenophaga sp. PAMC20947]
MYSHASVNRLYRLVWNEALMIWVAVAETARGRGKSGTGKRRTAALLAMSASMFVMPPAMAGPNIQPDGRTQTSVSSSGGATNVSTSTTSGSNAFNSFSAFGVGSGDVVNLHVPSQSANLINFVTGSAVTVDGVLNSIKNNQVGGNVFFATPQGFVVGTHGVVNVGSLTVSTPTNAFVTDFFSSPGTPVEASLGALLSGTAPGNPSGNISIKGVINASGSVRLNGGSVSVSGAIKRGARFVYATSDFTDVVNANGLEQGTKVVEIDGRMMIVADTGTPDSTQPDGGADGTASASSGGSTGTADASGSSEGTSTSPAPSEATDPSTVAGGATPSVVPVATQRVDADNRIDISADTDVDVSGTLSAMGNAGVTGGTVNIQAGNDIALQDGARILTGGQGANSSGGVVNIFAANSAIAHTGALVDSSAGTSGSGGAIEFSAKNNVELAGGEFRASATDGARGSVLIDPTTVTVSANYSSDGADHTIIADDSITVNDNIVLSTRRVAGGQTSDQVSSASIGNSGDLKLQAGAINLGTGSALVAFSDDVAYSAGNITLEAARTSSTLGGTAEIKANGSIIRGNNVSLTAQSSYDDTGATVPLPLAVPSVTSKVDLNDTTVTSTGTLTVSAKSSIDTATAGNSPLGTSVASSTATVDVRGNSSVSSVGDAKLSAESKVASKTKPAGSTTDVLPADAGVAVSVISSTATVKVGGTSHIHSDGELALEAKNEVDAETVADVSAGDPAAVGGTVAVTEATTVTKASIEDAASTQSASLKLSAESKNTIVNTAKAAAQGAKKQTAAEKAANASETEAKLDKYKDEAATSEGSVDVAAAVAVVSLNSQTQASINSSALQNTTGLATVHSQASNSSTVEADGSTVGDGASVGVGAAVGVNIGVLSNNALIADTAQVTANGLTVKADMPVGKENHFSTTAKSGAGASNVGVAGALGVNTVVSSTVAALQGDAAGTGAQVNAGTGDVLIEAAGGTASTVTVGADVKGTGDAAKVGVGASVGVNVAVNATVAEVADKAILAGGANLGLNAKSTHTMSTTVTGGAAGAKIAVTPVVAVSVGDNTTVARLGESTTALNLSGAYSSTADQSSSQTTVATGQTQGNKVSVGASLALGIADDTVLASVERDITATTGVGVNAKSVSKSDTSATASVKGGKKADADGKAVKEDGTPGKSVDEQVGAQGDSAKTTGKKTAGKAGPATTTAGGASANDKLDTPTDAPKGETSEGGVSVAAAVGVNSASSTTTASIGTGRAINSTGGALSVTSTAETDASAKADGSQTDAGGTNVGVGAAVAVNAVTASNVATLSDNATVDTAGLTVKAGMDGTAKNDFVADAKSGAGAGNVGVAGSLAINTVVNTTVANLQGDTDLGGTGASVNANGGNILIEAENASTSTVTSGADVKGTGGTAKVGVGASVGVNVVANKTVAEVADKALLTGGADLGLNATADHTMSTNVTGGASGAKIAVTPVVAVSIGDNTTIARLGASITGVDISGAYSSAADQSSSQTTVATGQTQGSDVSVGASLALGIADDTVLASVERDITATTGVGVNAKSVSKSDTSATASVKGGKKADADGKAVKEDGTPGKSVDEQVTAQGDSAKDTGKKTADKAPTAPSTTGGTASSKLDKTTNPTNAPKGETSEGGVSVAAAVGINSASSDTTASIGKGLNISSTGGALSVTSTAETDAKAKADGSQTDAGGTDVGIGAAVAVNAATATNTAIVSDNAQVSTKGLTIKAGMDGAAKNDFAAEATSGAGAGDVGVAGSLGLNIVKNTTSATLEGDTDSSTVGASVNAGAGDVLIEANNASTSLAKATADVKGTGAAAKVGVGASVAVNVVANKTIAEVADKAVLTGGANLGLNAKADHAITTEVKGGAAGAKVSITPVVAVAIAANTTTARMGESATDLTLSGKYSSTADQKSTMLTKAEARAQGDVAVGASLAAAISEDKVTAELQRDIASSTGVELIAKTDTSITSNSIAGAKGAKESKKNATTGEDEPEAGTTVDEQKKTQLDSAKSKNTGVSGVNTDTQEAKTPDTSNETPGTDKPASAPDKEQKGKKVSVAAAIGVGVARNEAHATIGNNLNINAGAGELKLDAQSDTNYTTSASGEAVSDDIGIGVGVAITTTTNVTEATLGAGTNVSQAGDVNISAASRQNRGAGFEKTMSAEAISGASGGKVAVAGALALVVNDNTTRASIEEGATLGAAGTEVGHVSVTAEDTSKISAQARAGALSTGSGSKAGVGASFAVLVSNNTNEAIVGRDADKNSIFTPTEIHAASLKANATKNRVSFGAPVLPGSKNFTPDGIKNFDFDTFDPANYLGSNNYYTEAIAGAASQGNTAVAGAFAVNVFNNKNNAAIGDNVDLTTVSSRPASVPGTGVEVSSKSDTQALSISGAAAGAKQTGVGISNSNIVSLDKTTASIGSGSDVKADGLDAGVTVSAESLQDIANVSVSAGASTSGTGVAGVLGVIVALADTKASIADGAMVKANGDVSVKALNDYTGVLVSGGVGAGGKTGVGAAIAANVVANTTEAIIGVGSEVSAKKQLTVDAQAKQDSTSAVVAGAGGGTTGIAGALSVNVIVGDTKAMVEQGAQINTDALYSSADQGVAITAGDSTDILAITGGGAGGGTTGVGAALDTTVIAKTVKAGIANGTGTVVNAKKDVLIDASSSEDLTSITVGFAGGGTTGVGGAVSVGVVKNDIQAMIGSTATVDADGNVGVNAQDDIDVLMAAGGLGGGGTTGVGGSIAVATLLGTTKATIGNDAVVNARGLGDARSVYSGETALANTSIEPANLGAKKTELAKGLSVTAYNREELNTTVVSAGGGGTTGVAATVSADVIASTTEASIGQNARINETNAVAGADQEVRVKAIDETSLINSAGGAGGGGSAGVGAAANVGVIAKTTTAKIGKGTLINAKKAVEIEAASLDSSLSTTVGLAGGGSVGVGGAVAGVGIANTTEAYVEDGTSAADAAKINVTGGDLTVKADEFANSWMISGGAGGGGSAGVGASLSVAVNSSTTKARIGNFAETNATGITSVKANSTESVNTVTVAGAGGGSAGIAGSIAVNVVLSNTEAGIGSNAKVNQTLVAAGQRVDVEATDRIESLSVAGAAAGGGAAGVGAGVAVTVAQNTTQAYIANNARVSATQDISVDASSDKLIDSVTVAGSGGGSAGVAGAISIVAVGSLLDGDSNDGLGSTAADTDDETGQSKVGNLLGSSAQSQQTKADLDSQAGKMAIGNSLSATAPVPLQNTTASIGAGAQVQAGRDVTVAASDKTEVLMVAGGAAGGGAAGIAGTLGVVLLRDSAAATVGNGATVDAGRNLDVNAETKESLLNIGVSAAGGGAVGVSGSVAINVISSETVAAIGASQINQQASTTNTQSVSVQAKSDSELITVAGSGGGGGAAAVGGVLNVNTLSKTTDAHIAEGANVDADKDVRVAADSEQKIIGAGISVQGSGTVSVGGAAAVNVIDNNTQAYIGSAKDDSTKTAARVDSDGNVAISAADDTLLMGVSASATGSGAAAVGGAVGVNVISSETLAYLGNASVVNARGNAATGATVYDGSINQSVARALPMAPAGKGGVDIDGDGVSDGNVNNGASFELGAKGSGGDDASDTSNPETTKDSDGNAISGITGGLGTRGTETVKGFSVTAVGSEKVVTASLGVAAGGAAGVTGTVTANIISSKTEASIGDGAQVNKTDAAGAVVSAASNAVGSDPSVRVLATDDSLVVMASGTMSGGIAGVSGSLNTAVVGKQTSAIIGDADVKAKNVDVRAEASEDLFLATANVSVGAAGIGAAVSVASVSNTTTAGIDAGANVDATGDLRVKADQDTAMDMYTLAGSGGVVAVSGAVSVGVVDNTTKAYVGGATSPAQAATLNAGGATEVAATSKETMSSVTASAAAGGVGVAGSVGVKVVTSKTTASIGDNARVNQTRNGGAAQDVIVSASDTVSLKGGGAAGAVGGFGVGAMSDTNIVRNTTTASIGNNALIDADHDVRVSGGSSKNVESTAIAIAAGALFGGAGSASVAVIGASLDADSKESLGDGATGDRADAQAKQTNASSQLDDVSGSSHLTGAKSTVNAKAAGLGVKGDINETSVASQDKTQAFVGNNSRVTAGGKVDVTASDKTQLNLTVTGAAGGAVGVGAAVGVGISNSTTEAFVGSSTAVDAVGDVSVKATAANLNANGSKVGATAGAGGVIGVSAAVSVLKDTSTTRAYLGSNASVERADELLVSADTDRKATATTIGVAAGGLAIGASVASATFGGTTAAYFGSSVDVGQTAGKSVNDVTIMATDGSVAEASAIAGAAGILAGSGADATAKVTSGVSAYMSNGAEVTAQDDVKVIAEATPETHAEAKGVSIGAGSVGASLATASTTSNVDARIDAGANISGNTLDVVAQRLVGAKPTTSAQAFGASGGVLFGINATLAKAESGGATRALVGDNSTLTIGGATKVHADSNTLQSSSGVGISIGGLLAVGADYSQASSSTVTEAALGNLAKVTGGSLEVSADSADTNYAHGIAGSGGLVSAPFSEAKTTSTSTTVARTGSGNNTAGDSRKIDVGSLVVRSTHNGQFDAWMKSTNASLIGVSGAKAVNYSSATTEATVGANGYVESDSITVQANNVVRKGFSPGTIPGVTSVTDAAISVPTWNVDSSSGGLADVPAASSTTTISNAALAQVAAGAHLEQTGSIAAPGAYKIDAWNDVTAKDRVKMASGGAISAASGKSLIYADTNNATVRVGDGAALSATGDLAMGTHSLADISTQTSVDVWGLVGVAPAGDSVSRFKSVNSIEVGDAALEAENDIRLYAGASTAYDPAAGMNAGINVAKVNARTDVFNNTAIPVNRDPVADAIIESSSQVTIDDGAVLSAVRHISLAAEKGSATASGVGVGKDIYREALAAVASAVSNAFGGGDVSFETRTGKSVKTQSADVAVNGQLHVGTHRKQSLDIGFDGTELSSTDGISIANTEVLSPAQDIVNRIQALKDLIKEYTVDDPTADASIAVAAYNSEITFLERKLLDMGFKVDPDANGEVGFTGSASISPLQAAQDAVNGMKTTKTGYTGERTVLTDTNTTLGNQNTTLGNQNTTLGTQNTTLTAEVDALIVLRDDPDNTQAETNAYQRDINAKNGQINSNTTTIGNNNTTIGNNNTTIGNNNTTIGVLTGQINALTGQIVNIEGDINANKYSTELAAGPSAKFLTISDAEAKLGNIYLRGDRLHGNGVLDAPGDAEIKITNNGPSFLILNNLSIPPDEGGRIYFNSIDVKDNNQINGINGAAAGAGFDVFTADSTTDFSGSTVTQGKPRILVESKYDPLDPLYIAQSPPGEAPLAPDIIVKGNISNLRGLVKIDSAAGSIRLEETASIQADDVEVKTRNGDFVQSYTDTFSHVAGAPLTTVEPADPPAGTVLDFPTNIAKITRTPETAGSGIVANGSVLIAARYLNINGTIQSGIPEWGVRIPATATVAVSGLGSVSFAQAKTHYQGLSDVQKGVLGAEFFEVDGSTVSGLAGNEQGNWEKVTVRYNAKEDRLELGGVRVQGGYIEIFGQIINTNAAGGGNLRVLDGYGQVKIDNESSLPMWVNLLDTGKGVKGQINITDIRGLKADGTPNIVTSTYTRAANAARTGDYYDPTAGTRFNMTVGYDTVREDYYRYSQNGWFGGAILSGKVLDQYKINSIERTNSALSQATYLQTGVVDNSALYNPASSAVYNAAAGTITGGNRQTKETSSGDPVAGRSWRDCNWWTLCANATHYQEFTVTAGSKTTITESVKSDHRIGIEYIGFDQGKVDVSSVGSVVLNGSIQNASGQTGIVSGGSITQNGDLTIVSGTNVNLAAGTGIGSASQAVQTNIADSGQLDATSNSGEVHLKEMVGNLTVGTIGGAGVSNVVIEVDKNIVGATGASFIQGKRVELLSNNGAIGATGTPLNVRTGYTANQAQWPNNGLMATARDNINIRNQADGSNMATYNGNLLLISAESKAGDVRVETTGAVIDNNPYSTIDSFGQAQLVALWDELRLRGPLSVEKADEAVDAFTRGKDNNYRQYWQLRKGQADQGAVYNAAYAYTVSAGERAALVDSGLSATDIAKFEADRTDQYHTLHAEVGGFTATFDGGFDYAISVLPTTDEEAKIRAGATWSDAQLALSVGSGLLKNITDTVTTIKEPNAKGRNVELVAGTAIGSMNDAITIDLSAGLDALTTTQKAALAAAERGDASVSGNIITILQPRAVNVAVGAGALDATAAAGNAFIGSEQDLRINQISATGDIRIKAAGSLINATVAGAGIVNVTGGNMILESANGGIGAIPDPTTGALSSALRIDPRSGSSLIARAAGDIWVETPGDLTVDTIFSRSNVKLDSVGSILGMPDVDPNQPAVNIRSNNVSLTSRTGSIGEDDNALDVGVNKDGAIDATTETAGKGIYLNGPTGEYFNVASSTSGGSTRLSASESVKIKGTVTGPGNISLVSGGDVTLTTDADVHSTAIGVAVRANSLAMDDDGTKAARLRSDVGTIDIETANDASITGIETGNGTADAVRVVSTAGRVLDAGDTRLDVIADALPDARFTVDGKLGVGSDGNPLDVRVRNLLAASADGSVALDVDGGVNVETVTAGDAVQLTASGDITGDVVTSTGAGTGTDQSVTVTSTGGSVELAAVSGQKDVSVDGLTGVDVTTVTSANGSVLLNSGAGNVVAGTTTAGQNVTMTAGAGTITARSTTARGGDVTLSAYGDIDAGQVSAGGNVLLDSVVGDLSVDTLFTRRGLTMNTRGDIQTGTIDAGGDVDLTSTRGSVQADNTRSRSGSVAVNGQRGVVVQGVRAADDITLASAGGAIDAGNLSASGGSIDLTASGNIQVDTGTAEAGSIAAQSSRGNVDAGVLRADAVSLSAPGAVTARSINVGSRVSLAGNTVKASVNSTGLGDVGGSVTGFGGGMASDVQLALNTPYAFRLSTVAASTGNIDIAAGDLFVDRLWVGNRMTINNPFTSTLIDQNDRSIQPVDVQLYSAGDPFAFGLTRYRVFTDTFVVARKPTHEIISPLGNNLSAAELGDRELSMLWSMDSLTDGLWGDAVWGLRGFGSQQDTLVSFEGTPVATEEACEASSGQGSSLSSNAQCEEKQQ